MGDAEITVNDAEIVPKQEQHDVNDTKQIEKNIVDDNGEKLNEIVEKIAKTSRNSSDIFSLKKAKSQTRSELFSFRGVPTKLRIPPAQQQQSQQQPPLEQPPQQQDNASLSSKISTSSKIDRNPLTGSGLCSNDEFNTKPNNRKDGNPILGVGYIADNKRQNLTRIPPGGHSHGLW